MYIFGFNFLDSVSDVPFVYVAAHTLPQACAIHESYAILQTARGIEVPTLHEVVSRAVIAAVVKPGGALQSYDHSVEQIQGEEALLANFRFKPGTGSVELLT